MILAAIAAVTENGVIGNGKESSLPWHLPADLRHFRTLTLGHTIVMGRHTHLSIGRALPQRCNIVLTHNPTFSASGCTTCHSLKEAIDHARDRGEERLFIIGGGQVYSQALPLLDRLYLTLIHTSLEGDILFPILDEHWEEIARDRHPADGENPWAYSFLVFARTRRTPLGAPPQ